MSQVNERASGHRHDPRLMPAGADEGDEIGCADGGGRRILERVIAQELMRHHPGIQHNVDAFFRVVDETEGGDRARLHTQHLPQELRPAERKAARADPGGGGLQVNLRLLEADDEPKIALVVLQKQVLAMPARDLAPQGAGLLDGVDGRVVAGGGFDPEALQPGKQFFAGRWHGGLMSLPHGA
jgi:hypothetical protein